jgi:glycosyltransferase involved in cell wall biosynthesis
MQTLFISDRLPPDPETEFNGTHRRMQMFLTALAGLGPVDLLIYLPPDQADLPDAEMQRRAAQLSDYYRTTVTLRVCPGQSSAKWQQQLGGISHFNRQFHFLVGSGAQQVQALQHCLERRPDAIFAHRLTAMAPVLKLAGRLGKPALPPLYFDLDDIEHIKLVRELQQPPSTWQAKFYYLHLPALIRGELQAMQLAQNTFICSKRDRQYLSDWWKASNVVDIPNALPIPAAMPLTSDPTLLLLGTYGYPPNVNGANFLIEQVMPLVLAQVPKAKLLIGGSKQENIRTHGQTLPGVEFLGFVEDLNGLYARSRVVCCPIFSGGGTRVKMVEAATYGKPIVATQIGAEGLDFVDGLEYLRADSAEAFAQTCIELLRNNTRAETLGQAARQMALQRYDQASIVRQIQTYLGSAQACPEMAVA